MWDQLKSPAPEADVRRVVEAFSSSTPRCGSTRVLAIDGPSGSGKTQLALGVKQVLGLTDQQVVHMDALYPGWDGLTASVPLLVEQVLAPLSEGEPAAYRRWNWQSDRWGETTLVPPTDVLLVEGCGCSVGAAGEFAALRVWVQAPEGLRYERAMSRDGPTYLPHWERWMVQERALYDVDGTRNRADLVINTGPPPTDEHVSHR